LNKTSKVQKHGDVQPIFENEGDLWYQDPKSKVRIKSIKQARETRKRGTSVICRRNPLKNSVTPGDDNVRRITATKTPQDLEGKLRKEGEEKREGFVRILRNKRF